MIDQDLEPKFSWPLALFVLGVSFLIFCKILELLNSSYPTVFIWVGLTALTGGCITAFFSFMMKPKNSARHHGQID